MPLGRLAGADKGAADPTIGRPMDSLEAREPQVHRLVLLAALYPHRHLIHQLILKPTG